MHKFKVGQRVRRSPKYWPVGKHPESTNRGTVLATTSREDNNGKTKRAYLVGMDSDKARKIVYVEIELVAL